MVAIKTIADTEQVTEPGAYRMSMDLYHSQRVCPGLSISSTGVRAAALQSPHAFWKSFAGNPNRYPEKDPSDSLILGRAAHSLILGDEVFDETFAFVPADAPPRPTATQIKAYERDGVWSESAAPRAEFWEAFDAKAKGKLLLPAEQVQKIQYMAENLAANPLAMEVLRSDLIEISLIWQDEETGLWLKSRPDCIPTNGADFSDLKTTSPKGRDIVLSCQRAITDFGYHLQMAMAAMGAEQVFGTSASDCVLVFCQTSEPYEVVPIRLDEECLYIGKVMVRHGINRIAHGFKTGDWPGAGVDLAPYSLPPSMAERLLRMQADGELPNV